MTRPVPHVLCDYDRARHERFVLGSWARSGHPREAMAALLRRPDVRCVVAAHPDDEDALFGWAAAAVNLLRYAVLWAWVKELNVLRRHGLATSMLIGLGVDFSHPVHCRFWSPDAAAIAARDGYRLVFSPYDERKTA